jgi:hypothetical protein
MKIVFSDGSFLELMPNINEDKLNLVLCGFKDFNQLTMSSLELDNKHIDDLINFLTKWRENT